MYISYIYLDIGESSLGYLLVRWHTQRFTLPLSCNWKFLSNSGTIQNQWLPAHASRQVGTIHTEVENVPPCPLVWVSMCVVCNYLAIRGRPHSICANFRSGWGRCPRPGPHGRISQLLPVNYKNNALYNTSSVALAPAATPCCRLKVAASDVTHTRESARKVHPRISAACSGVGEWRYPTMRLQGRILCLKENVRI